MCGLKKKIAFSFSNHGGVLDRGMNELTYRCTNVAFKVYGKGAVSPPEVDFKRSNGEPLFQPLSVIYPVITCYLWQFSFSFR